MYLNDVMKLDVFSLFCSFPGCRAEGQFLLHPSNRCKYLRCTNAPTSLSVKPQKGIKDAEVGSIKPRGPRFYTLERACALGTAMALSHYVSGHSKQDRGPLDKLSVCSEHVDHNPKEGKDACTGTSSGSVCIPREVKGWEGLGWRV